MVLAVGPLAGEGGSRAVLGGDQPQAERTEVEKAQEAGNLEQRARSAS